MEDFGEWRKRDDIQSRRLSIIDFSSEDDSLLGASSESLGGQRSEDIFQSFDDDKKEELFERVGANKLQEIPETEELVPELSECSEPQMSRKIGKCNLRKSLAWDSAFLTCEGIVDADELSSMISIDKSQGRMLPGIQEEVQRSTDSISTLGSDTLTLESVESGLFEDVRASIQRSRNPVKVTSGVSKVGLGIREAKAGSVVKKVGLASQSKLKPKVVARNPSIGMQIPGKLPRPVRGSLQVSQSMATSKESSSSVLKRPKVLDKPIPSSARIAKRASLGVDLLKAEKDNTKIAAGRGAPVTKVQRNVPRPTKSSSLGASSTNTTGPTSSVDSSGSTSSVKSVMSPLNSMKRTTSKTGNPTNSSRLNSKTPSRAMSRDSMETGKSRLSAQSMPSPRISSNISPASSISDWSSESVSSISSTQHISHGLRDGLSRSYSSKVPVDVDSPQCMDYNDNTSDGSASRGVTGNSISKASTGMIALHQTSKPSGLRLPSPKIGFFDGAKSTVRATPKRSNPVAPSNLPKTGTSIGTSPRGSGIKSKLGNVNPEKAATTGGAKTNAQSNFSNMKPKISLSPEVSKAATNEVISGSATPPLLRTNSPLIVDEEDNSNGDEFGNGRSDMGLENKDDGIIKNDDTADAFKAELIQETQHSAHREEVGNGGDGMSSLNKDDGIIENNKAANAFKVALIQETHHSAHREEVGNGGDGMSSINDAIGLCDNNENAQLILETQHSVHRDDVKIGGLSNISPASDLENLSCLEELTKDESKHDKEDNDLGLQDKDIGFSESNEIAGNLKTELMLEDVKITGLSKISPASDLKNANCLEDLAKENPDSEDQIDCLTRQLGSMEIRGTEGMLFDEPDNSDGVLQLNSSHDITVSVEKEGSQNSLPKPIIFITPESDKRIPFSAKDSLCNISAPIEGEKTSQPSPPFSEDHFETD